MKQAQAYDYDLAVIGGGPAGYTAAAKAGKAGMKTLLIEEGELGGVCLNRGCIPTKTLLASAKGCRQALQGAVPGVSAAGVSFSMEEAQQWKSQVVNTYRKALASLMKSSGVEVLAGRASFVDRSVLSAGGRTVSAGHILAASGTQPAVPPIPGADLPHVTDSTGILELAEVPGTLAVIGGGIIGLECACLYAQLGTDVHVIEMLPYAASQLDSDIRKTLLRALKSLKHLKIHTGAEVTEITDSEVRFTCRGAGQAVKADKVLIAAGREADTGSLNLPAAGIKTSKGFILVNDRMQTSAPRVYAAGDVVGKSLYAHAASRMGEIAVDVMLGKRDAVMEYHAVPWVVYTYPEAAGCGITEQEARESGCEYITASVPMRYSARHYSEYQNQPGLVKLIVGAESRQIMGIHAAGAGCSEMIWGGAVLVQNRFTLDHLCSTMFPHPTVSEVIREAAFAADDALKGGACT